jgi:hypothetical protein
VKVLLAVLAAATTAALAAPFASATAPKPVPSLQPQATQKLWTKLVRERRAAGPRAAAADCRPLRGVFYTSTDWLRLATKLAANASPCAQYYISIPPLAADKTNFRYDQPWRIRALGPSFHVLAEINWTGWSKWVAAGSGTWYEAGQEARRRMAAQGFDVASGDSWIVNELSSAVRANTNVARQNVRDLVRGLYEGDGTVPQVKGGVYITGIGQSTADLSQYKLNLQNWYLDAPFWQDMSAYVSDWSQEVYGDVRDYAVAGASLADRASHLNDYLAHELALADAAPADAGAAAAYLNQTYSPLANGAWIYDSGFGFTNVPVDQMEDYVSAQTYALRSYDLSRGLALDHFGFAWAPKTADNSAWTTDYANQSAALLDRLAAAIRDSGSAPEAACAGTCTVAAAGASFVETWKTFATWSNPALGFATPPVTATAGSASGPISVQLQQVGIAQTATAPVTLTLASSSATGAFSAAPEGPWTATLSVDVPAGASSVSFYYSDTKAGTATLTATAAGRDPASQAETVQAGPLASLAVSPASASVSLGSTTTFTASGADAYGNAVSPSPAWSATGGTVSPASGATTTFTPTAAGTATITATANGVSAAASVTVTGRVAHVSSITYTRSGGYVYVTVATNAPNGTLGLRILRSGVTYASGTVSTGSSGTVTVRVSAPGGCYSTTITSLSASGYAWDGATPSNGRCV